MLWQLTRELVELGVKMTLPGAISTISELESPSGIIHMQLFRGYTAQHSRIPINLGLPSTQHILEFLSWLMERDNDVPFPLEISYCFLKNRSSPCHGFKQILNALRTHENFSLGMCLYFLSMGPERLWASMLVSVYDDYRDNWFKNCCWLPWQVFLDSTHVEALEVFSNYCPFLASE